MHPGGACDLVDQVDESPRRRGGYLGLPGGDEVPVGGQQIVAPPPVQAGQLCGIGGGRVTQRLDQGVVHERQQPPPRTHHGRKQLAGADPWLWGGVEPAVDDRAGEREGGARDGVDPVGEPGFDGR